MRIDVDNIRDNTFFVLAERISEIKEKYPDKLQLLNILLQEAKKTYAVIRLEVENESIPYYTFNGANRERVQGGEEALLKETEKTWEEYRNNEILIHNMVNLTNHFKRKWQHGMVYKPFLDEIIRLAEEIVDKSEDYQATDRLKTEIASKQEEIIQKEKIVSQLKEEYEKIKKAAIEHQKKYQNLFTNTSKLRFITNNIGRKVAAMDAGDVSTLTFYLYSEGSTNLQILDKEIMRQDKVIQLINKYPSIFKIIDNLVSFNELSLDMEPVQKELMRLFGEPEVIGFEKQQLEERAEQKKMLGSRRIILNQESETKNETHLTIGEKILQAAAATIKKTKKERNEHGRKTKTRKLPKKR